MTAIEMPAKGKAKSARAVKHKEFELSSGEKVFIREAKGKDAEQAHRIAGPNNREKYVAALVSLTVTIDGKAIVQEEFSELPLRDYNKITEEFGELNF